MKHERPSRIFVFGICLSCGSSSLGISYLGGKSLYSLSVNVLGTASVSYKYHADKVYIFYS